ncbi:MAG: SDR family oxidoreductase [Chloroflexi bacterium]|nr:SDR family oxidoreductase [Chloroflexota bacterium]
MRLKHKVAIITGASSGFGRASAILFAREGAKVVVVDVNDAGGEETVRAIRETGGEAVFVHTDVSKAAQVERLVKTTVDTFGKLDILFNNAGRPQRPTSVVQMAEEEWDLIYSVNVKGIFLGAKYAVPELRKAGGGVIINTASISAVRPRMLGAAYASSKGAAIVLTKALALELARDNIRVNAIAPVAAETPMFPQFSREGADPEQIRKLTLSSIPLGRLAQADDVAFAALYLASDESSMVTGTTLDVDGGRGV